MKKVTIAVAMMGLILSATAQQQTTKDSPQRDVPSEKATGQTLDKRAAPRDMATGQASGKREAKPRDAASGQSVGKSGVIHRDLAAREASGESKPDSETGQPSEKATVNTTRSNIKHAAAAEEIKPRDAASGQASGKASINTTRSNIKHPATKAAEGGPETPATPAPK